MGETQPGLLLVLIEVETSGVEVWPISMGVGCAGTAGSICLF